MPMAITELLRLQTVERELIDARRQIAEQAQRIQTLETRLTAARPAPGAAREIPDPLRQINASRQTRCDALRAAIGNVLAMASAPESITAKGVAQELERSGFEPMPRDRTVRLRLAEVRAEMATHGNTGNCQKTV